MNSVKVGHLKLGNRSQPFFIAGPCVIESERHCLKMAERSGATIAERLGIDLIFKASYDKANRTSSILFRGPGLDEGLRILEKARAVSGLPVLSDVHETLPGRRRLRRFSTSSRSPRFSAVRPT